MNGPHAPQDILFTHAPKEHIHFPFTRPEPSTLSHGLITQVTSRDLFPPPVTRPVDLLSRSEPPAGDPTHGRTLLTPLKQPPGRDPPAPAEPGPLEMLQTPQHTYDTLHPATPAQRWPIVASFPTNGTNHSTLSPILQRHLFTPF